MKSSTRRIKRSISCGRTFCSIASGSNLDAALTTSSQVTRKSAQSLAWSGPSAESDRHPASTRERPSRRPQQAYCARGAGLASRVRSAAPAALRVAASGIRSPGPSLLIHPPSGLAILNGNRSRPPAAPTAHGNPTPTCRPRSVRKHVTPDSATVRRRRGGLKILRGPEHCRPRPMLPLTFRSSLS